MRPPLTVRKLVSRMRGRELNTAIGAVVLLSAILALTRGYIQEVVNGPQPLTLTELINAEPASLYGRWFDFTAEDRPRHLLQTSTRRCSHLVVCNTEVTNHFALIRQSAYIVETKAQTLPPRFLAWASEFQPWSENYKQARSQLNVWIQGGITPLSPVLLTQGLGVETVRMMLGMALTLAAAITLYLLWRAIRLVRDYKAAAPVARLRNSVRAREGLPALIEDIDKQLARIDPKNSQSGVFLLSGWLISLDYSRFDLMSADDIFWIAPYTRKTKLYGAITTHQQELAKVYDRYDHAIELKVRHDAVAGMMQRLSQFAPWAVTGGDVNALSSDKHDALIAAVDKRRAEIRAIWAEQARQLAGQR
jgi:hypothetical protein